MTYTTRQLRRGSDVFGADGGYIGTVVWLHRSCAPETVGRASTTNTDRPDPPAAPPPFSGESIGPMPTAPVGNGAPSQQTAATAYASSGGAGGPAVSHLVTVRLLVALNWSGFRPRVRRIPVSLVQVASLERIVLTVPEAALD